VGQPHPSLHANSTRSVVADRIPFPESRDTLWSDTVLINLNLFFHRTEVFLRRFYFILVDEKRVVIYIGANALFN
jgi:hypothetical protein